MINYRKHRRAIEQMYEDKATIIHLVELGKDPVTHETKQDEKVIHTDLPCKLSQTGLPKNGQTDAQNDIQYDAKLFIAPEIEIKQGDIIKVTRKATGQVDTYSAGKPFPPYSSHQELLLTSKEWA